MRNMPWIRRVAITLLAIGMCLGCGKKQTRVTPPSPDPLGRTQGTEWEDVSRLDSRELDGQEEPFIPPVDVLQIEEDGFLELTERAPAGPKLQIPELTTVYFDFDTSIIRTDQEWTLRNNAEYLLVHPEVRVEVQGHCDERGTESYNLALGDRRAQSVRAYLTAAGVEPERVYTISYGEAVPAAEGQTEAAYSQNRRAEFWIISD